jgi:hypothetical protein
MYRDVGRGEEERSRKPEARSKEQEGEMGLGFADAVG